MSIDVEDDEDGDDKGGSSEQRESETDALVRSNLSVYPSFVCKVDEPSGRRTPASVIVHRDIL